MPDNGRKESRIVSGITTKKGSRKDAREVHREEHGAKAPRIEHTKKGRDVDVRNANEMRTGLDRKWRQKGGKKEASANQLTKNHA